MFIQTTSGVKNYLNKQYCTHKILAYKSRIYHLPDIPDDATHYQDIIYWENIL